MRRSGSGGSPFNSVYAILFVTAPRRRKRQRRPCSLLQQRPLLRRQPVPLTADTIVVVLQVVGSLCQLFILQLKGTPHDRNQHQHHQHHQHHLESNVSISRARGIV
jgi:hypothetical protein